MGTGARRRTGHRDLQTTRQAIRDLVYGAFHDQYTVRDLARMLRLTVGPLPRDVAAIARAHAANIEILMESGVPYNLAAERADALARRMAEKAVRRRALTIARTEIIRASNQGKLASWNCRPARAHGPGRLQEVGSVRPVPDLRGLERTVCVVAGLVPWRLRRAPAHRAAAAPCTSLIHPRRRVRRANATTSWKADPSCTTTSATRPPTPSFKSPTPCTRKAGPTGQQCSPRRRPARTDPPWVTCICPDDMAGDVYVTAGFVDKMNATTETRPTGRRSWSSTGKSCGSARMRRYGCRMTVGWQSYRQPRRKRRRSQWRKRSARWSGNSTPSPPARHSSRPVRECSAEQSK